MLSDIVSKHPQASTPTPISTLVPCQVEIFQHYVIKALKSFPAGTAPGLSGLRASHLKEVSSCPSSRISSLFQKSLSKFMNVLCSGVIPSILVSHLCGASLTPLKKKSNVSRPIAAGEILRRLASQCISVCQYLLKRFGFFYLYKLV